MSPYGKVLDMSWSENLPRLCVWKWPNDGARYVCIEPWTDIPTDRRGTDDFDVKSMCRLEAGESDEYYCVMDFV